MDFNIILAAFSVLLLLGLTAFFSFLIYHQQAVEPKEEKLYGVELLEQHYAAGATVEQPTPYFVAPIPAAPDPLEIAGNLDKKIVLGAALLFSVFAMIGAYFVAQPAIRAAGSEHQEEQAVRRGKNLYANFCFDCHGKEGKGDVGVGLPLNKPDFKYDAVKDDPSKLKQVTDLLTRTIERGRAKPPGSISMPAWSVTDGGSLNDEQVLQLVTFILHGTDADWADVVTVRQQSDLATEPNPPKPVVLTGVELGRAITQNNPQAPCVTCHSFDASKASPVALAPNLARYGVEGPLNDENKRAKASDPGWLQKWVSNAPSIKPGILMPAFNKSAGGQLDDAQIKAVVEYLESLGK